MHGGNVPPVPGSGYACVSAQLLLREGALDIGVALHRAGPAGPGPGRVPGNRVAGHAVDLRALRA